MTRLFNRDVAITIGTLRIASRDEVGADKQILRVTFKVEADKARDPNKAEVKIWNLSADSRAKLQEQDELLTTIKAGYIKTASLIFSGDMRVASSVRDGSDWVTALQAGDGGKSYKSSRFSKSYKAGAKVTDVLKDAVESMVDVGVGNLQNAIDSGGLRAGLTEYVNGMVASGKSADIIDQIVTSMGLEWSIQDGQVQILEPDQTTQDDAVLLSPRTGLLDSPTAGEKGIVTVRSLLQPGIFPGVKVKIESREYKGAFFKAQKVTHTGDTWGQDWFTSAELKPL